MSVPAQNLTSALAIVAASSSPTFLGPANQGFRTFGANDSSHSYRVGAGVYKMRLVQPIDFAGGEGKVAVGVHLPGTFPAPDALAFSCYDATDKSVIYVLTTASSVPADVPFWLEVTRVPQSLA